MNDDAIIPIFAEETAPCMWCDKPVEVGKPCVQITVNIKLPLLPKQARREYAHTPCAQTVSQRLAQMAAMAETMKR